MTRALLQFGGGVTRFGADFEAALPGVIASAQARQAVTAPELTALAELDLVDAVAQAIGVCVELGAVAMRSPTAVPREAPDALLRVARLAAQYEIACSSLLRTLRGTHAVLLDALLEQAEPAGLEIELLERMSSRLFAYMDALVPQVTAAHDQERRRLGARPESRRTAKIRAVLAGSQRLDGDYPLEGSHLALVLRGGQARVCLRALMARLGVPVLAAEAADQTVWAWFACDVCEADAARILDEVWSGGCTAGLSGSEPGPQGFRSTHRKARMALRLGRRQGTPVTTFGQIALEALAFGGEQMAREFVQAELGPLLADDARTAVMRETVAAYFALGNAASAARRLGVSERAVVYRLRHAEELLGRALTARRAELETALRLHDMFESQRARAA